MEDFPTLFGQSDAALDIAGKSLTLLEQLQAGGVPLICLAVAVVCGIGFYWQLRRNGKQSEDALSKAESREAAAEEMARQRLTDQEGLMREMLDRDRQSQESIVATVQAVQGVGQALGELQRVVDRLEQTVSACMTNTDAKLKVVLDNQNDLSRSLKSMEGVVRRCPRDV